VNPKAIRGVVLKTVVPAAALLVILIVVIAWLAGGFTEKIPGGPTAVVGQQPDGYPDYGHYKVQEINKPYIEEAIGTLKAASRTEIASQVLATIDRITVSADDEVAAGKELVLLDAKAFEAQLSQAEAELQAADAAVAQAEDRYNRATRARESTPGAIAEQDFNRMKFDLLTARANQTRARQAVAEAQVRLSYTTIRAPKSGTIVDRWAEEGDMARPGVPLLTLYDRTTLRLEVPVMGNLATKIHKGDKFEVHIDDLNKDFRGVVDETVPQAEAASRSFLVKVRLPPSEELDEGMFGRLKIPAGTRPHLCLDTRAIQQVGQLQFVTVVDPKTGTRERRFIKTGRFGDATHREVISGLRAGDVVLLHEPAASQHDPSGQSSPGSARVSRPRRNSWLGQQTGHNWLAAASQHHSIGQSSGTEAPLSGQWPVASDQNRMARMGLITDHWPLTTGH